MLSSIKNILTGGVLAAFLVLGACKPAPNPAPSQPAPSPSPASAIGQTIDKLKDRTDRALDQSKQKLEELANRFDVERDHYAKRFERQLNQLEPRLADLKKRVETATEQARPEIERSLRQLEERTKQLRERLELLRLSTTKDWDQIKKPWQDKEGSEEYEDSALQETST